MSEMSKSLSLRERIAASSGADAPVKSGRPHSFDRDFSPLDDIPLRPGLTPRECIVVLARLSCVKEALQQLAFEASDLGLAATWLRLSSVEDDVGDAITKVQYEIQKEMSVEDEPNRG